MAKTIYVIFKNNPRTGTKTQVEHGIKASSSKEALKLASMERRLTKSNYLAIPHKILSKYTVRKG